MPSGHIMVIAPNYDLRRSLAFALEAEGYVVTSHETIPGPEASRGYDCVVLDHKVAASASREAVLAFCTKARGLILLAGMPQPWLAHVAFRVVQTPVMGEALFSAVRGAVDLAQSTA